MNLRVHISNLNWILFFIKFPLKFSLRNFSFDPSVSRMVNFEIPIFFYKLVSPQDHSENCRCGRPIKIQAFCSRTCLGIWFRLVSGIPWIILDHPFYNLWLIIYELCKLVLLSRPYCNYLSLISPLAWLIWLVMDSY